MIDGQKIIQEEKISLSRESETERRERMTAMTMMVRRASTYLCIYIVMELCVCMYIHVPPKTWKATHRHNKTHNTRSAFSLRIYCFKFHVRYIIFPRRSPKMKIISKPLPTDPALMYNIVIYPPVVCIIFKLLDNICTTLSKYTVYCSVYYGISISVFTHVQKIFF